jgi:CBS domain-containing protein
MLEQLAQTCVSDIAQRRAVCLNQDRSLEEVVVSMREFRRGSVLAMGPNNELLGIFTERDLAQISTNDNWRRSLLSDHMSVPVRVLETDSVAHALTLMKSQGCRRLPIVDSQGIASGVLSIRDILTWIVEHYPTEFQNLPPDPSYEASHKYGG